METTPSTTGTTLEVLAPYLPYGIEVEIRAKVMPRTRGLLLGMRLHSAQHRWLADVSYPKGQADWPWHLADCLPVLRPFSALTTPLSDGTVPAVEVAKLMVGEAPKVNWAAADVRKNDDTGEVVIYADNSSGVGYQKVCIWPDTLHIIGGLGSPLASYDYLRSQHFALPVNGRTLVEGVDYIAKL